MRKLVLILAALAAAAGSSAVARPRHKPVRPHAPTARASVPTASKTETHVASAADPALDRDPPGPMPAFGGLAALSEAQARSRLGPPDIARSEGAGAMWTYRLPDCALFLFFRAGAGQALHVSGASAGPRSRGQTPLPVEACIAEAQSGRSGPGKS